MADSLKFWVARELVAAGVCVLVFAVVFAFLWWVDRRGRS